MSSEHAVVVTGSTGGLGAAAVERFAAAGYRVFGLDRAASAAVARPGVQQLDVDVCSDADVRDAFAEISAGVEVVGLVHCAGIAAFGPKNPGHLISPESGDLIDNLTTIERTLRTNLLGSFTVVRHAAAAMAQRTPDEDGARGFVVLTSSGAALDGKAGQSAYSASKSGVIGMTLPLARELGRFGIRVVTIAPGLFDTPILDDTPPLPRHVPFPARMGEPHEFAALAHHIAENSYINGEVIRIDGGIRGGFESPIPFIK
ncbi:MAG: SDR family NAD(P)-dependent oxidoreductase [Nocardioides sp.]|uniref:SDR family NAD(P)-dependent oxidoreductase n=1 Tax=Nocardioides sp. TaxID=35761 RepID=UPI003D6A8A9C